MQIIKIQKCTKPEKFLEMINECIEYLEELKEKIEKERTNAEL